MSTPEASSYDNPLIQLLISRDKLSREEAYEVFESAKEAVESGEDPEEVLLEYFTIGLDYINYLYDN